MLPLETQLHSNTRPRRVERPRRRVTGGHVWLAPGAQGSNPYRFAAADCGPLPSPGSGVAYEPGQASALRGGLPKASSRFCSPDHEGTKSAGIERGSLGCWARIGAIACSLPARQSKIRQIAMKLSSFARTSCATV
jgi:hypothetical protein